MMRYDDLTEDEYFLYVVYVDNYGFVFEQGRTNSCVPENSDFVGLYQIWEKEKGGDHRIIFEDTDPVGIEDAAEVAENVVEELDGVSVKDFIRATEQAQLSLGNFLVVKNAYGVEVDYDAAVSMMDSDIREDLHRKMAPCSNQAFFDAYCAEHKKQFGEAFEFAKKNPVV